MKINEFAVTTNISINILEYENFYFINDCIYPKKLFDILEVDPHTLTYLELNNLLYEKLINALIIPKEKFDNIGSSKEFSNANDKQCFDILRFIGNSTVKCTKKLLEKIDESPADFLHYLCIYDHSVWDYNFNRVSTPIHLDYIDAGISNKYYNLNELREHILNLPESLVKSKNVSGILDIPHYNRNGDETEYLNIYLVLQQDFYNEYIYSIKCSEINSHNEKFIKFGMYGLEFYEEYKKLKNILGFKKFAKKIK